MVFSSIMQNDGQKRQNQKKKIGKKRELKTPPQR